MRTDTVPEIGYTREAFNRTVVHAAEYNVSWVIPWIALGCGYRRVFDSKTYESFEMGWNYECAFLFIKLSHSLPSRKRLVGVRAGTSTPGSSGWR